MASRRFARRPRRRFNRGVRQITSPRRWEVCNFFFDSVDTLTDGIFLTESVELLKIIDHVGGASTTTTRGIAAITRKIEVGGLVFNYGWNLDGPAGEADTVGSKWQHGIYLVTDRLDENAQPVSLPNWNINQAPVATAPSSTGAEDIFPMRIHWRDSDIWSNMAGLVSTPVTNANIRNNHPTRTQSLRIRGSLDDYSGLYFQFYDLFISDGADSLSVHKWVWGTLYYRWKF